MLSKLKNHVLFGSILAIVLLICRMLYTGKSTYSFIIWNMFLAYVPLLLAQVARRHSFRSWKLLLTSAIWLLFFPNAPYLITDLYHLSHIKGVPPWYDALMLYVAAYTCVAMGFLSLRMLEAEWNEWLAALNFSPTGWRSLLSRSVVIILLFFATGFGIYLGRELRYNSWDIITDTHGLAVDIAVRVLSPIKYFKTWGFTAVYAVCLYFFYNAVGFNAKQDEA